MAESAGVGTGPQRRLRLDPLVLRWLALTAAWCAIFSLWTGLEIGGTSGVRVFDDLALLAASAGAGIGALWAARRIDNARQRTAWRLLGASGLAWALGQAAWSWYQLVADTAVPFPGLADVGYIAQMPLAMAGIVAFGHRPGGLFSSLRVVLDGLLITSAMTFLGWAFFLGDAVDARAGSAVSQVVALSYPIGYVAIGAVVLFVATQERRHPGFVLYCIGLGVLAITSGAYTALSLGGTFYTGHPIDVGWLAAFSLMAVASLQATRGTPIVIEERVAAAPVRIQDVALPYAPVLVAAAVTLLRGGRIGPFLVVDGVTIVTLLVLRQLLAIRENVALNAQLEDRVVERTAALERSEQRFAAVVAQSTDMCILVDAAGRLSYVSPAASALLEQTGPAQPAALPDLVHPDDRVAVAAFIAEAMAAPGTAGPVTFRLAERAGVVRHIEVVATNLLAHDAVHAVVVNGRDVTERLAAESQRAALESQLQQAQRLDSLGQLAGGIAHDFKNLLSVIVWTSDLLLEDGLAESHAADIREIRRTAQRGADLSQQLLAFSRHDIAPPQPIDVGGALEDLSVLLRRTLGDDVMLTVQVDPGLGPALLNRARFDQLVVNLAVNARDAMPHGGQVTITGQPAEARGALPADLEPGRYLALSVADTGSGMAPEVIDRVFEPFFTTKEVGQGTGLGLAMVHGIVAAAGGAVQVESELGHGTTVTLYLPMVEARAVPVAEAVAEAPTAGSAPRTGCVVMIVEDEEAVRRSATRLLRALGFDVEETTSPHEALEIAGDPDRRIDVVLSDISMPLMTGPEFAAQLEVIRPGLSLVFMSGYTGDTLERHGLRGEPVLEKPFTREQLVEAITRAVG